MQPTKQGVILVNLGTPEAPTPQAIADYLQQFLSDRLVVDLPSWLWQPLLNKVIVPKRAKRISQNYQSIWLDEGSPLRVYSQQLVDKLQQRNPHRQIELAMTYGEPSLKQALLKLQHCQQIQIIPLFPQYSTTTTQPVMQQLRQLQTELDISIPITMQLDYAEHPAYLTALRQQIFASFAQAKQVDALLLSFHGIPLKYIKKRQEPYVERCKLTFDLLQQQLQQAAFTIPIQMSFQSRFGLGKWTSPDTLSTLKSMAKQGIRNVQVICPGFAVDCIETLDEIARLNRDAFIKAGGHSLIYIAALNASDAQVELMQQLIQAPATDLN